jgi:hypothetical protein
MADEHGEQQANAKMVEALFHNNGRWDDGRRKSLHVR